MIPKKLWILILRKRVHALRFTWVCCIICCFHFLIIQYFLYVPADDCGFCLYKSLPYSLSANNDEKCVFFHLNVTKESICYHMLYLSIYMLYLYCVHIIILNFWIFIFLYFYIFIFLYFYIFIFLYFYIFIFLYFYIFIFLYFYVFIF